MRFASTGAESAPLRAAVCYPAHGPISTSDGAYLPQLNSAPAASASGAFFSLRVALGLQHSSA